jgi:hypothetical protein
VSTIQLKLGPARLTNHGKKAVAQAMFHKGKNFLAASVLLERKNGFHDVVLHLLGQGLEIIQKALLLARDFNHYSAKLLKPLGHDLIRGYEAVRSAFKFRAPRKRLKEQLDALNIYYRQHLLRYGGVHDVLGAGGHNLKYDEVLRHAVALTRYGNRLLK